MEDEQPLELRVIQGISDLPKNKDDLFWREIKKPSFKAVANILIVDAAIKSDPVVLTDAQCRSQLAKIYAYAQILRSPEGLAETQNNLTPIPQPRI